jgi:glutaredoxin
MKSRLAQLLVIAATCLHVLAGSPGCDRKSDDGTAPGKVRGELPTLSVSDDAPNLMLTWLDEKGETHVEMHPADVPAMGRDLVRVVVSDREDGTRDLFYVVDLTRKESDGSYSARTMRRRDWEALIEQRRSAYLAKNAPPSAPGTPPTAPGAPQEGNPPTPGSSVTVIIYGAAWCHPCHDAAAYLKSKGIAYVMKDIEENPAARVEMAEKLEKVGRRGGSIPIIDVQGEILVGYSRSALDRALAKASKGTLL